MLSRVDTEEIIISHGIEISTRKGHLIALNVKKPIKKCMGVDETVDMIHAQNGLVVLPHPFDIFRSSIKPKNFSKSIDAIETINASSPFFYLTRTMAEKFANSRKLPVTGGSDSHIPQTIGDGYTIIDTTSRRLDDIMDALIKGRTQAVGNPLSLINRARKMNFDLKRFLGYGFK